MKQNLFTKLQEYIMNIFFENKGVSMQSIWHRW